jgi:hypothetical protein
MLKNSVPDSRVSSTILMPLSSHSEIKKSKIIIFGLILTTFESSSISEGSWDSIKNWLKPKTEPP